MFSRNVIKRCGIYLSSTRSKTNYMRREVNAYRTKRKCPTLLTIVATVATGIGALGCLCYKKSIKATSEDINEDIDATTTQEAGCFIPGLPFYSREDIRSHDNKENGVWVTFRRGVYDVTQFLRLHRGGADQIMLAAGDAIDPFWEFYGNHLNSVVFGLLEEMRIGNCDAVLHDKVDYFTDDPKRSPSCDVGFQRPFSSPTPRESLMNDYITPSELFFVRNHFPVPLVDVSNYTLQVEIEGGKTLHFTLEDLKSMFDSHSVMTTLQCTGNRKGELLETKSSQLLVLGSTDTMLGNAVWRGVRLRDVLLYAGLEEESQIIRHVQFEGLDTDVGGFPYGTSIPITKAVCPYGDVILAYEMNGEELPRDHGYPLRVIVPGVAGARNVKWLGRIVASGDESQKHWQQVDYRTCGPDVTWENADSAQWSTVYNLPVQSLITYPESGSALDVNTGDVTVKGVAYSGGGNGIIRVDVSIDGGETWQTAELQQPDQQEYRTWAWTFWSIKYPLPKNHNKLIEILCKAVDTSHNNQPSDIKAIYNLRGYANNAWHKVTVRVEPNE